VDGLLAFVPESRIAVTSKQICLAVTLFGAAPQRRRDLAGVDIENSGEDRREQIKDIHIGRIAPVEGVLVSSNDCPIAVAGVRGHGAAPRK